MINELKDEEILEYLMTSDFIENYKPEEYKYLLSKFRYFYRILHGNKERITGDLEHERNTLIKSIDNIKKELHQSEIRSTELQNKIDLSKKERKLTWKERWEGKTKTFP